MNRRIAAAAALAGAALALIQPLRLGGEGASARPIRHPPVRFSHMKSFEAFGYYLPRGGARVGRWRLDDVAIGQPGDFAAWERGRRSLNYAPVMLEFSDMTSPTFTNELGQEVRRVTVPVLPDSYRVRPGEISFSGHDRRLGVVILSGYLDGAALARARSGGSEERVIRGGLQFAGERIRNIAFTWFGGD